MKTPLINARAIMPAMISILFFSFTDKNFAQDFQQGIVASSFSAAPGYQSAILSWAPAAFPMSGAMQAGYLIIYSTSAPTLVSSPEGLTPDFAVFNGTIVSTTATSLPLQPATFATANGLTNGITYNLMIVAYTWDGISSSTYQYSSPSTICITLPPDEPGNLNLPPDSVTSASISGLFDQPLFTPDGYIVIYSTSSKAPAITNGHVYNEGDAFGMDTVAQISNSRSFNTLHSGYNLSPSTTYYIYVFSYSVSGCSNTPVYSTDYLTDSITTLMSTQSATVMLDYFKAAKADGYNKLTWKAACSSSLFSFEAQKSLDSINFTDIDTVSMANTSECALPFNYNDYINIEASKIYYRIKITGLNAHISYSNIAAINSPKNNFETIRLAQNPVQSDVLLQISSSINDKLELMLVSIDGRELQRKTIQVQAGMGIVNFGTASLAKGIYIIIGIFSNGKSNVVPFIKQ